MYTGGNIAILNIQILSDSTYVTIRDPIFPNPYSNPNPALIAPCIVELGAAPGFFLEVLRTFLEDLGTIVGPDVFADIQMFLSGRASDRV